MPQASALASLFHDHGYVLVTHELLVVLTCFVSCYTPLAHLEQSTLQETASPVRVHNIFEMSNVPKGPMFG